MHLYLNGTSYILIRKAPHFGKGSQDVYWEKQRFELPKLPDTYEWRRFVDTALDEADEVTITEYWLQPRSVAVFIGTRKEI